MQKPLRSVPGDWQPDPNISSSSNDSIPQDWIIDLQRIAQHHADECHQDGQTEFMFSVLTWFLDHQKAQICREPKIVFLGGDITEWREDLIQPWQHRLDPQEHVFLDLVQPATRRANLEEHLAHVILTQRYSEQSSILVSMEFVDATEPSVVVRTAVVAPPTCTTQDIVHIVPLLQSFVHNQVVWSHPAISNPDQQFRTWSGLGITVQVHTDSVQDPPADAHEHAVNIPTNQQEGAFTFNPQALPFQPGLGLTEASEFVQDLHDHWTRVAFSWGDELEYAWFLTWFVDHRQMFPRCMVGRMVALTSDFMNYRRHGEMCWIQCFVKKCMWYHHNRQILNPA
jgi:hypothetical protein